MVEIVKYSLSWHQKYWQFSDYLIDKNPRCSSIDRDMNCFLKKLRKVVISSMENNDKKLNTISDFLEIN